MRSLGEFTNPDPLAMRRTMGRFLTGVAIITTGTTGEWHGMTINSLTSISLEPPIVMVSLAQGARTTEALLASKAFAVSVLSVNQEGVARRFAQRGGDRFDGAEVDTTASGLPVIQDALCQLDCTVIRDEVVGDHRVFFGEVTSCRDRDGAGVAFIAGKFGSFHDFGHAELPWVY